MNKEVNNISEYTRKAKSIINKLNRYTDDSFLECFFNAFRDSSGGLLKDTSQINSLRFIHYSPWSCYLAFKWKFIREEKYQAKIMKQSDFGKVINSIIELQSLLLKMDNLDDIFLDLRRLIVSQSRYQISDKEMMMNLVRQYIWYCKSGHGIFDKVFKKETGVSLEFFYMMSLFLFTYVLAISGGGELCHINLNIIVAFFFSKTSTDEIISYFKLISIRKDDLRSLFEKNNKPIHDERGYFEITPLLNKSLILLNGEVIAPSKYILRLGISSIVPRVFKEINDGSCANKFGATVERYLERCIKKSMKDVRNEKEIKSIYSLCGYISEDKSKVVDYLISESGDYTFIDSKAVIPHNELLESKKKVRIINRMKNNLIEGVEKGQYCANLINKIEGRESNRNDSILVVLQEDHFISSPESLNGCLSDGFYSEVESKINSLPVSRDRVYYLTISDLERLVHGCKENNMSISEFISKCSNNDADALTRRMSFSMHLDEIFSGGSKNYGELEEEVGNMLSLIKERVEDSKSLWESKKVYRALCVKKIQDGINR